MTDHIISAVIGIVIGFMLAIIPINETKDNHWQKLIVGNGCGHYTTEGQFAWNKPKE